MATPKVGGLLLILWLLVPTALLCADEAAVEITGEVSKPLKLTMAELKAMPVTRVEAKERDGTTSFYDGISLHEILRKANVPLGESLHADALALALLVKAADGYKVTIALPELDRDFSVKKVILAYAKNGSTLDPKAGPLRLIIPDEKRQSRWVRQVSELEIVRLGTKR